MLHHDEIALYQGISEKDRSWHSTTEQRTRQDQSYRLWWVTICFMNIKQKLQSINISLSCILYISYLISSPHLIISSAYLLLCLFTRMRLICITYHVASQYWHSCIWTWFECCDLWFCNMKITITEKMTKLGFSKPCPWITTTYMWVKNIMNIEKW